MTASHIAEEHTCRVAAQFLCDHPKVHDVFQREMARDIAGARLSKVMRLYYQLRPVIPLPVRQFLQGQQSRPE